ncbi:MAG: hypothetical protein GY851_26730, partial [bacterium]|nr:hypothetical protein [bacterium]
HIHTVEDAVAFHCIDLEQWVIVRAKANSWTVTMSGGRSSTGEDTTYLNTQVSLTLEPVARPALRDSILALINRIPPLDTISAPPAVEDDADAYTMELCLFDHHFGMLSWHAETGEDYDIGVARRVYLYAVDKALAQAGQYPLARVVIPIGNDFFHMNDQAAVTPRGHNKLDTDCRLAKVSEAGQPTALEAVKRVAKLAPVEVVFVPGNHDPEMGYYLCRVLARCFERSDHVTVDASAMARKYRRFGNALIGFTHLSDEKEADLPVLMATEASADWADAVRHNAAREWHVGHIHKKRERVYTKGDSYAGVYVRHLQSLCGTDAWHFSKGYIRTLRAVESFLWHHSDALCAHFEHRIPQSMYRQARGE